jgi:hypothetical protein
MQNKRIQRNKEIKKLRPEKQSQSHMHPRARQAIHDPTTRGRCAHPAQATREGSGSDSDSGFVSAPMQRDADPTRGVHAPALAHPHTSLGPSHLAITRSGLGSAEAQRDSDSAHTSPHPRTPLHPARRPTIVPRATGNTKGLGGRKGRYKEGRERGG